MIRKVFKRLVFFGLISFLIAFRTDSQPPVTGVPLLDALNSYYHTFLAREDLEWVRPVDAIRPLYGKRWPLVYGLAWFNQFARKGTPDCGVPDVRRLFDPVPVIYVDPWSFYPYRDTSFIYNGFCSSHLVRGREVRYCVVKNRAMRSTLRHELSHSMQPNVAKEVLLWQPDYSGQAYYLSRWEVGVRVAEMKRNYHKLTGKLPLDTGAVLRHFFMYQEHYSEDVRDIFESFSIAHSLGHMADLHDYSRWVMAQAF